MTKVLIIGAGIGGLTTALALAQREIEVDIFERAAALGEIGAGLQLSPNAMAVFQALGLGPEIEAVASQPEAGILRSGADGAALMTTRMGETYAQRYGYKYLHIHRADLIHILKTKAKYHNINIYLGHDVKSCEDKNDRIKLGVNTQSFTGDYLIAADGIRSIFRKIIAGESTPKFTGQLAWRGTVPAHKLPNGLLPLAANNWLGAGQHFVAYYIRKGQMINFVAVKEQAEWTAERWDIPANKVELKHAFQGWDERVSQIIEASDTHYLWGLFDHAPLKQWTKGRMALLGDAAHPMLPFMAQGAAMAIEDAWVIAACIARAPQNPKAALPAYQRARRIRATHVQQTSRNNAALFHMKPGIARSLRDLKFKAGSHIPAAIFARLDKIYGVDVTKDFPL